MFSDHPVAIAVENDTDAGVGGLAGGEDPVTSPAHTDHPHRVGRVVTETLAMDSGS
jgi:hypothetical protein